MTNDRRQEPFPQEIVRALPGLREKEWWPSGDNWARPGHQLGLRAGLLSRETGTWERKLEKHGRSLSQRKWCLPREIDYSNRILWLEAKADLQTRPLDLQLRIWKQATWNSLQFKARLIRVLGRLKSLQYYIWSMKSEAGSLRSASFFLLYGLPLVRTVFETNVNFL